MRPGLGLAAVVVASTALLAGCGGKASPKQPSDGVPRLDFGYDATAPLGYRDRGVIDRTAHVAVHDISFRSGGKLIQGYLLVPSGAARRPAVIFGPGSGGDRGELLQEARKLAARNVVTLTITPPSTLVTASPTTPDGLLAQARSVTVSDVVAVRRAVDLLRSLPGVDGSRVGYLGWSLGAKTGTFVAAAEPRVKAVVLLSAGADTLAAFVASAPPTLRAAAKRILGSVDPIRSIGFAASGRVLLEDGTRDEVVPRQALLNVAHAAPKGTVLRWYAAPHALNAAAYRDAFDWLVGKLATSGSH